MVISTERKKAFDKIQHPFKVTKKSSANKEHGTPSELDKKPL